MPNRSKQKGDRAERKMVALLNSLPGVTAEKIPLSGAVGGSFAGDIDLHYAGMGLKAEVKSRKTATGWKKIIDWLGANDLLFLLQDRTNPLVVMPWGMFYTLIEVRNYDCGNGYDSRVNKRDDPIPVALVGE